MVKDLRVKVKASIEDMAGAWYGGVVVSVASDKATCTIAWDDGDMHQPGREGVQGLLFGAACVVRVLDDHVA